MLDCRQRLKYILGSGQKWPAINYLSLHAEDAEVNESMKKYRADTFNKLMIPCFLASLANVIIKAILLIKTPDISKFDMVTACFCVIIMLLWAIFTRIARL